MKKSFLSAILIVLCYFIAYCPAQSAETFSLSGNLSEKKSGENVIGLSVAIYLDTIPNSKPIRGAVSNKFGFYSIPKLDAGKYWVVVRGIGYELYSEQVNLDKDISLNIKLSTRDIKTQEVVVTADKLKNSVHRISSVDIKPDFVLKMPSLGGESDVFRTLQLLPGVKAGSEISSGLYIRGGSPDQNLILLDGVIVYNPSHLGGFLSSFNSDALRDIKLIKGAFPAEYGGRLSSVIDMTMKEGTKDKFSGSGGISLISSRLTLEGPINDDCSFMISGRRMYLDLLIGLAPDAEDAPNYYFYDLNAKINYKLSENDRLFVSGFFCRDVLESPEREYEYDSENFGIFWGNQTANIRWMHILSPTFFTNLSLIYTNYNFNIDLGDSKSDTRDWKSESKIEDYLFRLETQYFPNADHTIKSGAEITFHSFDVDAFAEFGDLDVRPNSAKIINTVDAALFIQDEWKITELLNSNIGARGYYFSEGDYFSFEPRLSFSYSLDENSSLTASTALANQFLHMIARNDIPLPTDVWYPSNDMIKPSRSWQSVLGYEYIFNEGEYLFSIEGYYKTMENLVEYKENAGFSFGVPLDSQFTFGSGRAYGIELFLNKRVGDFTGWIGYTLSWTKRTFAELNFGKEFYPRYDRRHDVSITLNYQLGKRWELGASWVFGTGQAYTMPTASYSFDDIGGENSSWYYSDSKYLFSDKNAHRLPAFHKLDLNFMYKYEWFGLPFQFSINIYNAYNRRNPFIWYIGGDYDNNTGEYTKKVKQVTLFPIIPTFGLSFKF